MGKSYDSGRGWTYTNSEGEVTGSSRRSRRKRRSWHTQTAPYAQHLYTYYFVVDQYDDDGDVIDTIEDTATGYSDTEFFDYIEDTYPEYDGYELVTHEKYS